jgi:TolA-binding protein
VLDQAKRAFDQGDYAAAARLFEQVQQTSPGCDILFYLGLARYRLKQPDAALIASGCCKRL